MRFVDRVDAGRRLAARLRHLQGVPVVVLGLPRGGVPVAAEVARDLGAPLDVILVRKLGVPFQPELGMGAIGEGGVRVLDPDVVRQAGVGADEVAAVEAREREELERRAARFRGDRPPEPIQGRTVVVVDDGIATGSTARAACRVARAHGAARVLLAVPVAPAGWEARIGGDADEFVCLSTPTQFFAIGQFYDDFAQTSDDEVVDCLARARAEHAAVSAGGPAGDPPAPGDPPGCRPAGRGPAAAPTWWAPGGSGACPSRTSAMASSLRSSPPPAPAACRTAMVARRRWVGKGRWALAPRGGLPHVQRGIEWW